jgi:hypothetical protein
MMFNLPNNTECTLTSFVGRTQKSGQDDVPAVTFRLKLESVTNAMLDLFSPTMRLTVYAPVEGQEQLPGVELVTPVLRSKDLKHWEPETLLEGWRVIVARGIDDDSALQMGNCKVDDFRFDFYQGGHMDVDFRVSTGDIGEDGAGMLWGRQKRKVFVMISSPAIKDGPVIDGTTGAFRADHPEADLFSEPDPVARDAESVFAEQHGGQDGEAGPGAGDSDEPQWPEPDANSSAADTGAAEFEAGVQKALDDAGVAPKAARRGRRAAAGVVE